MGEDSVRLGRLALVGCVVAGDHDQIGVFLFQDREHTALGPPKSMAVQIRQVCDLEPAIDWRSYLRAGDFDPGGLDKVGVRENKNGDGGKYPQDTGDPPKREARDVGGRRRRQDWATRRTSSRCGATSWRT